MGVNLGYPKCCKNFKFQFQVKELSLLAQETKEKHIKGESDLSELTKAIDLISGKFDDYERERREKDKIIKELKSEVLDLNISFKNLEN